MPLLWNTDHQPLLVDPINDERAVMPGESYEFTDEQVAAGLAGSWADQDPRSGLEAEKAFKKRRDQGVTPDAATTTDSPAVPEKE